MGVFLYLPGLKANQAAHDRAVLTPTPAADVLFPIDRLKDGRLDRIFKFGSTAANYQIKIETDRILNGNLNAWASGAPTSWTKVIDVGNPTLTETTTGGEIRSGSAAEYTGNSADDVASVRQDFLARAGEPLYIDGWMRGNGTIPARCRLLNRTTGKYLLSGGTWGAAADLFTETGTTYANKTLAFTVESFATRQIRDVELRLILYGQGSGSAYWDDWFVFPRLDFFAVFGHNINAGWTAEVKDSALSLIDTMTIQRRAFYKKLSAYSDRRVHNIVLTPSSDVHATNFAPQVTEVVAGAVTTLGRNPMSGLGRSELWPRVEVRGVSGSIGSILTGDEAHIEPFTLDFRGSRSHLDEFLENVWSYTRGGFEPVAFVPDDALSDVFCGKLREVASVRREANLWTYSAEFEHLPYQFTL
jgi:hypothetical protein